MSAPIKELVDNFESNTINTLKWAPFTTNTTVAQTGGVLKFVTTTLSGYAGITSFTVWDLTGSSAAIQVVNAGNQSLASMEVVPMSIVLDANNRLFWYINSGNIQAFKKVATVQTSLASASYNSTNHQWFRIRESAGTIYFETSPNAVDWTVFASLANPFALSPLNIEPSVGTFSNEASGTTVLMDNFNIVPPMHPINSGLRPRAFAPGLAR